MTDLLETLSANIATLEQRIKHACGLVDRARSTVRLLPVTKTQPVSVLLALSQLGFTEFGENYSQELTTKNLGLTHALEEGSKRYPELSPRPFVYIGRLQSNKFPLLARCCHEIQTIESLKQVHRLAKISSSLEQPLPNIFISINLDQEPNKGGVTLDAGLHLADQIRSEFQEDNSFLRGFMAIPKPIEQSPPDHEPPQQYRLLASSNRAAGLTELSLGMSGDLEEALLAGSTCLRIGTALLGPRLS